MESEISKIISTIKSTEDGANVEVERKEGGTVKIKPRVAMGRQYPTIGVSLSPNFVGVEKVKTSSAAEAAKLSVEEVKKVTKSTANGLANFFKSLVQFGGKGTSGAGGSISGPVGVIKLGSDVIGSKDWSALINFAAAISINLGVVNALPLPSLDGGQVSEGFPLYCDCSRYRLTSLSLSAWLRCGGGYTEEKNRAEDTRRRKRHCAVRDSSSQPEYCFHGHAEAFWEVRVIGEEARRLVCGIIIYDVERFYFVRRMLDFLFCSLAPFYDTNRCVSPGDVLTVKVNRCDCSNMEF